MSYDITPKNIIQYILTKLKGVLSAVALSGSYNDLSDKPTLPDVSTKVSKSGDTMTGKLTISDGGLLVSGRVYGAGDDEGIIVLPAANGYAAISLGSHNARRFYIVLPDGTRSPILKFHDGTTAYNLTVPSQSGTIAVTSDIPDISTKVSKSGDTMTGRLIVKMSGNDTPLILNRTDTASSVYARFDNSGGILGYLGVNNSKKPVFYDTQDHVLAYASDIPDISTKVSKSGDTMTGTLALGTVNNVCLNLRPDNASWYDTISVQNAGQEAVVFASKNAGTSWMFVSGEDSVTNHASNRWQSLTPALQIKNGCVAIGKLIANNVTPTYPLEVNGDVSATNFRGALIGNADSATKATKDGAGADITQSYANRLNITPTGGLNFYYELLSKSNAVLSTGSVSLSTSSKKFKENIAPLVEEEAKKILDIETVTFDYNEDYDNYTSRKGYKNIGCIAEDVNEIIPELVTEDENGEIYGVNYIEMIPYLLKVVQMQQKQLDEQQKKIDALELLIKGVVE